MHSWKNHILFISLYFLFLLLGFILLLFYLILIILFINLFIYEFFQMLFELNYSDVALFFIPPQPRSRPETNTWNKEHRFQSLQLQVQGDAGGMF